MLRFANLDEFSRALGEAMKWRRAVSAIQRAGRVPPEVSYSVGDSLTYRVTSKPDCVDLTGHRRYLEVRAVLDGSAVVEVAPVAGLQPADGYDDLTDRQLYVGPAERYGLAAGEIVVIGPDEAVRDVQVTGRVVVVRVTVEHPIPGQP